MRGTVLRFEDHKDEELAFPKRQENCKIADMNRSHCFVKEERVKLLLVVLMLAASQAHGEVYTWKDSRGIDHYTNRKDDIPVRFRSSAKALEYDREPKAAGITVPANEAVRTLPPERALPRLEEQSGTKGEKKRRPERDEE